MYFPRGREALAIGTHRRQQPGRQHRAGPRKALEEIMIRMLAEQLRDLLFHLGHGRDERAQLINDGLHHTYRGGNHSQISGQRLGQFDLLQPLLDQLGFAATMGQIEFTQGSGGRAGETRQLAGSPSRRPTLKLADNRV